MAALEGKTKVLARDPAKAGEILMRTKDELTGGDAAKKEHISGIAKHKVTQTTNVFKLLESKGIPTSFIARENETTLRCHACDMLPLELVTRRYAWGSYLKRWPDLISTAEKPFRFSQVQVEFYHKHAVVMPPLTSKPTQMPESDARDLYLKNGIWAEGVYTDTLINTRDDGRWFLHSPKAPFSECDILCETHPLLTDTERKEVINNLLIPVFETLEQAWSKIQTDGAPIALADMKVEIGRREKDGKLVLADVIDNDSWRIWPAADPRRQLDKQCFREDHPLSEVSDKYALVAKLTESFNS